MSKGGGVYIISNKNRTLLYIGVTSDIHRRMFEHKNRIINGFAKKWNCMDLLYFEGFWDIGDAIIREKQMKKWRRDWKLDLIKTSNPLLLDISISWFDDKLQLIDSSWS